MTGCLVKGRHPQCIFEAPEHHVVLLSGRQPTVGKPVGSVTPHSALCVFDPFLSLLGPPPIPEIAGSTSSALLIAEAAAREIV
jgi:hypothetical protein